MPHIPNLQSQQATLDEIQRTVYMREVCSTDSEKCNIQTIHFTSMTIINAKE